MPKTNLIINICIICHQNNIFHASSNRLNEYLEKYFHCDDINLKTQMFKVDFKNKFSKLNFSLVTVKVHGWETFTIIINNHYDG